jgi:hypothetical protein
MPKIKATHIHDDVRDRMDNLVIYGKVSETSRQKVSTQRICMAINNAVVAFVSAADPSALTHLIKDYDDLPLTPAGDGISSSPWPPNVMSARADHGILGVRVGDQVHSLSSASSILGLKNVVRNPLFDVEYGNWFAVDIDGRRFMVPDKVKLGLRVIENPEEISHENYKEEEISLAKEHAGTIAGLATAELVQAVVPHADQPPDYRSERAPRGRDREARE